MPTNPDRPQRVLALRMRGALRKKLHYVEAPQETVRYLGRITDFKGWLNSWTIRLHRGSQRGEEIGYCTVERHKLTMMTRVFDRGGRQLLWADPMPFCPISQWPPLEIKALHGDWAIVPKVGRKQRALVLRHGGELAAEIVDQRHLPAKAFWALDLRNIIFRADVYREDLMDTVALLSLGLIWAFDDEAWSPTS